MICHRPIGRTSKGYRAGEQHHNAQLTDEDVDNG